MDTLEVQGNSLGNQSRIVGGTLFVLGWLMLSFLCGLVALVLPGIAPFFLQMGSTLLLMFPCLLIGGLAAAIYLGAVAGPGLWPRYYAEIESRPALNALLPGALAGIFTSLLWAIIIYGEGGGSAEMFLVAMVIILPVALLLGPI